MSKQRGKTASLALLALMLWVGIAAGQTTEFRFHWAPSPVVSSEGDALAPAISYEVWVERDGFPTFAGTVRDTIYSLEADPYVLHRIQVCGVDEYGRTSPMSNWSLPVYFELEDDTRSGETLPQAAELRPNFPNPFNPETRISYGVPEDYAAGTPIALEIYNLHGQRIRTLEVERTPGWHEAVWNGQDDTGQSAATGMYVTRYICGTMVETRKMTMLK